MANGFFLGGMGEGISSSRRTAVAEQANEQDLSLRTRALELSERQEGRAAEQSMIARVDGQISETMKTVSEIVQNAIASGKSPESVQKAVAPLLQGAKELAARVGRNPQAIDAQVQALMTQPDPVTAATVAGTAKGTGQAAAAIAETRALEAAGQQTGVIKDPEKRASAENSLRDDFTKQAQPFITVRDFWSNFQSAENSGAGDITRVFAFMKMQDPNSAVLPGEYATAQNAAGVPESVRQMYNKLVGGGLLTPEARNQLQSQGQRLYENRATQFDKLQTQFAGIAKRQGLKVDNVVIDMKPAAKPEKVTTFDERFPNVPAPPKGFTIVGK